MIYKRNQWFFLCIAICVTGFLKGSLPIAPDEPNMDNPTFAFKKLKEREKQDRESAESNGEYHNLRYRNYRQQIRILEQEIEMARVNGREAEVIARIGQLTELEKRQAGEEVQLLKNGEYTFKERAKRNVLEARLLVESALAQKETQRVLQAKEISAQRKKEGAIEGAAIAAQREKEAKIESTRLWVNKLSDPKVGALIVGTAAGVYAAKHGIGLLADWWRIPTLAQRTSIRPWSKTLLGGFFHVPEEIIKLSDVVLEPKLKARVSILATATCKIVENNSYFRHMLFYGPPGTGKTMLAIALAQNCGLEYIYFSAAKLEMYSTEEALKQLIALFEYAKASDKKLMIIIDEADVLCADRSGPIADKTLKLLNAWLTYTGTECSDYVVIALTNRFEVFDDAVKSRFAVQLEIPVPAISERKLLLNRYVKKYLDDYRAGIFDNRSFIEKLYKKNPARPPLEMQQELLDEAFWESMAKKVDGFVGRDISNLCLGFQAAAFASEDRIVSVELVNAVLQEQLEQKAKLAKMKRK